MAFERGIAAYLAGDSLLWFDSYVPFGEPAFVLQHPSFVGCLVQAPFDGVVQASFGVYREGQSDQGCYAAPVLCDPVPHIQIFPHKKNAAGSSCGSDKEMRYCNVIYKYTAL